MSSLNQAEKYVNSIIADSTVLLDLNPIFSETNDTVLFGVCNIIYQQVCIIPLV